MNDKVIVYRSRRPLERGQWRWKYLAAGNHKKLASGTEGYHNLPELLASLGAVLGIDTEQLVERFNHPEGAGGVIYRKGNYERIRIEVKP